MGNTFKARFCAILVIGLASTTAFSQDRNPTSDVVTSRVTSPVNEQKLVPLQGNTHPLARPAYDKGLVDPQLRMERMQLVLKRSTEQEAALAAFNERQFDPKSPDYHRWLHADEFGQLYGPSDSDIAQVTSWLQNQGFEVNSVGKGKVFIDFSGTAAQVQKAFHVEMHKYLVEGKEHIANDRDPQIPSALEPVIRGITSLNDFRPRHFSHPGGYVKRDLETGKYSEVPSPSKQGEDATPQANALKPNGKGPSGIQPEFGYTDANTGYQREMLSPYDVATIYNILPLWNESTPINGTGVKVAIIGLSDVETSDFNTFRSSFGLPAGALTTVHSGSDPGVTDSQGENTEDVEMVSSTAPGAQVVLVADKDNSTTNGLETAVNYVVDNEVAPILTMSYGECELQLGSSGNSLYNQIFQQAATQGISSFVAAGDSGSTVCTSQDGNPPYADQVGLAVSGMASTPYVTAVGGTDVQWYLTGAANPASPYWNSTNDSHGASAKGYMPEMSWNDTCSNPLLLNVYSGENSNEQLCNDAINDDPGLVEMASGSGGVSKCTDPTGTTSSTCAGGYAKPSWQAGVAGIPSDGKRDLPDVSMFAAYGFEQSTGVPGSALLICQASASPENSCDYSNPDYIIYQENGGTSAASPLTAGIMALIVQKAGGAKQGLANPVFYSLAANQDYAACNSNTVAAGNACIFNDITSGSNASVCNTGDPDCVTNTHGDQVGIASGYSAGAGYDLTTGLGTFNVANLVNAWPNAATTISVSPTSFTFPTTVVNTTSSTNGSITVNNTGTAAVSFTSISFSGTGAGSFADSTTCPVGSTLAAGASCTVTTTFHPTTTGTLTAMLNIVDGSGTQTVSISGVASTSTTTLSVTPASLTFASTNVGTAASAKIVTLQNTGTASITIGAPTITGANATSFAVTATTCGGTLAEGTSCTLSVGFTPAAAGSLIAVLNVSDDASGSPQTVTLTGTGAAAAVTATLTPATLTFAGTTVGATSASQSATLKNTGTTTLNITGITISGANALSYSDTTTCGTTLAAGASCGISVSFTPTAQGSLTAVLNVADNATGSPQTVMLTGTGKADSATATLTPATLTFSGTTIGTTGATQSATLQNTGTTTLTINGMTISGPNASSYSETTNCGATLAANASCAVSISFTPTAAGALTAALNIADNATGSPQTVTLTGTGVAPVTATLTPAALTFSGTTVGTTSAMQAATLKNTGTTPLAITGVTLSGANAPSYSETTTCGATLAAGASCTVSVAFTPTAAGSLAAVLNIADNATGSPQTVMLTGTGVAPILPTTTTLTASAASSGVGMNLTLTAVVQASGATAVSTIAGETVTFYNGTTSLGTGALDATGTATLTTNFAAVGSYSLTASYAGDAAFAPSTSSALSETVVAVGVTTAVSPSTLTIQRGSSGTLTITVTPSGGYTGTLKFSCGTLPQDVSCTFAPATLSIAAGDGAVTDTLTINTKASTAALLRAPTVDGGRAGVFVATALWLPGSFAALFGLARKKHRALPARRLWMIAIFCLCLAGLGAIGGCGGGSSNTTNMTNTTPAGTYTIPVTLSLSGAANQTINATVIVQ